MKTDMKTRPTLPVDRGGTKRIMLSADNRTMSDTACQSKVATLAFVSALLAVSGPLVRLAMETKFGVTTWSLSVRSLAAVVFLFGFCCLYSVPHILYLAIWISMRSKLQQSLGIALGTLLCVWSAWHAYFVFTEEWRGHDLFLYVTRTWFWGVLGVIGLSILGILVDPRARKSG
jgi:hypothetical protein